MRKIAIATACLAPAGGIFWSLPKTATVAKMLGADGLGVDPLRKAVVYQGDGTHLAVPALYVAERFSGPLGRIMSPNPTACERFVKHIATGYGIPIETHSPARATRLVQSGYMVWMETIPEFGYDMEDHLQLAKKGGFYLSVDNWDVQGRHGLVKPFGNPVKAMEKFLDSGLVRNIHAQPTGKEVPLILRGHRDDTVLAALLKVAKGWGYENLITLEVNPFGVWRADPLAILPGRYLRRLGQILNWVKKQIE